MGLTGESVAQFLFEASDLGAIKMKDIAEYKGWSESKLRRRLAREGTCYSEILNAERKRRCAALLRINPHADSALICKKTGLKRCHMSRNFKRWFGATLMDFHRGATQ